MIDLYCRYNLDEIPVKFNFKSINFSFMIDSISQSSKFNVTDPISIIDIQNRTQIRLPKIGNCYYRMTDHLKVHDKLSIIEEMKDNIGFMSRVFDIINLLILNINPKTVDISDITEEGVINLNDSSNIDLLILWSMTEVIPKDKLIITIF